MTNREIISLPSVAYYSGLSGLEIKCIEYGVNDRVLCVSSAWYGGEKAKRVHRVRIQYTRTGRAFIRVNGWRVYLDECIRM